MQTIVTWYKNSDESIIDYCAYITSDGTVNLSKTLKNANGPIKFKNQLLTCKQLEVFHVSDEIRLHVLFENGDVETIITYLNETECKLFTLEFEEPILKFDTYSTDYDDMFITLSTSGTIRFDNKIIISDTSIINFQVAYKRLILFYNNDIIKLYSIDYFNINSIKLVEDADSLHVKLMTENIYNVNHIFFYFDVLVLSLMSGEIVCSTEYSIIKSTNYYTIIKINQLSEYGYIAISELNICCILSNNIHVNPMHADNQDVENFTTEECYCFNEIKHSQNVDFYKSLQAIYIYTFTHNNFIIVVMFDDTVRTFVNNVEVFDIFEFYPKLYKKINGSYI